MDLARVYVRDALKRWVPGAQLVSLSVEQDGPALTLRVRFEPAPLWWTPRKGLRSQKVHQWNVENYAPIRSR